MDGETCVYFLQLLEQTDATAVSLQKTLLMFCNHKGSSNDMLCCAIGLLDLVVTVQYAW